MRPDKMLFDFTDSRRCDAIVFGYARIFSHIFSYIYDVIRTQFAAMDFLTTKLSTLVHFVVRIILMGSKEQMVRIYTWWVVTFMKNAQSTRNPSIKVGIRKSRRQPGLTHASWATKFSIPFWRFATNPYPASGTIGVIEDLVQKTVDHFSSLRSCSHDWIVPYSDLKVVRS